ncbi:MAG TPA: hemerythrin domain-containing protein [Terracidiphilus sp.]|nr:hemerythrin domain-containing protein [Terracidiphilus sp.]
MGIQIGAKPDSGFDDPIGMLKDCHRRIEHFLGILCVVVERAKGRSLSGEEAAAIQAALHYFRVGGQRHNADEEQSLFPRMRQQCAPEELSEIGALEHDHRHADQLHTQAESLYSAWISDGSLSRADEEALLTAASQLKQLYEAHIKTEEQIVFPRASKSLNPEDLAAIGQEFKHRRA